MSKQKKGHLILLCKKKNVTNLQYISRWLVHYKVSYNANKWVIHEGFPLSKIWSMKKNCGKNITDFSIFLSHVVWVFKKNHIYEMSIVFDRRPLLKIPGSATGHSVFCSVNPLRFTWLRLRWQCSPVCAIYCTHTTNSRAVDSQPHPHVRRPYG
jgi:hypothetical protein